MRSLRFWDHLRSNLGIICSAVQWVLVVLWSFTSLPFKMNTSLKAHLHTNGLATVCYCFQTALLFFSRSDWLPEYSCERENRHVSYDKSEQPTCNDLLCGVARSETISCYTKFINSKRGAQGLLGECRPLRLARGVLLKCGISTFLVKI